MQRRSFLGAILAACTAPAIVRSGVLMPIKQPIWVPPLIIRNELGEFSGFKIYSDAMARPSMLHKWNRALSDSEVALISADPWAIFKLPA